MFRLTKNNPCKFLYNPVKDLEIIKTEIILSDIDIIQKKLEKNKKLLEAKQIKILENKLKVKSRR